MEQCRKKIINRSPSRSSKYPKRFQEEIENVLELLNSVGETDPLKGGEEDLYHLRTTNRELYLQAIKNLNEVVDLKNETDPDIIKYLTEPMSIQDRFTLVSMYFTYLSLDDSTIEKIEMRGLMYNLFIKCKDSNKLKNNTHVQDSYTDRLRKSISDLQTTESNMEVICDKFSSLQSLSENSEEYPKLKEWLNCVIKLPFDRRKNFPYEDGGISHFLFDLKRQMDKELYGMEKVKEQILLFVNSKITNPLMKKCNIGLLGPAGCGKTSIARLLSRIMDFPFQQISLGGVKDSEYLKGHSYTYLGSQPGEIVRCLSRMKYSNGILFIDEYEKGVNNKDVCGTLLHITDPSQNSEYRDNYLSELTIDLSNIWFIYSMNSLPKNDACRDRIHVIELEGYTTKDKIAILTDYIFPKTLVNCGMKEDSIIINRDVSEYIVSKASTRFDKGVRSIEKCILDLVNKINFLICNQENTFILSFSLTEKLELPLVLTRDIVHRLVFADVVEDSSNRFLESMYM